MGLFVVRLEDLVGRDANDPLLLQFKEAQASVLEPYLGASPYDQHGRRVVEGQRLMQAASDVLLGWQRTTGLDGVERDFFVRQLWDRKGSAVVEQMSPRGMGAFAAACGWTLARAHARSGDAIAIAAYLGNGTTVRSRDRRPRRDLRRPERTRPRRAPIRHRRGPPRGHAGCLTADPTRPVRSTSRPERDCHDELT